MIHESIRKKKVSKEWAKTTEKRIRKEQTIGFVALKHSYVVGFIFGEIKGEGFGLEESGWIEFVGVDPSQMGIGIGRTLVSSLFEFFKKRDICNRRL
jgi:ribosomal protein S18 acetylase RimI-like enzyme